MWERKPCRVQPQISDCSKDLGKWNGVSSQPAAPMPSFLKDLAQRGTLDLQKKEKKRYFENFYSQLISSLLCPWYQERSLEEIKIKTKIITGTVSRNHTSTQLNFAKILVFFSSFSLFKTKVCAYWILLENWEIDCLFESTQNIMQIDGYIHKLTIS